MYKLNKSYIANISLIRISIHLTDDQSTYIEFFELFMRLSRKKFPIDIR